MEGFKKLVNNLNEKKSAIAKTLLVTGALLVTPTASSEQQNNLKKTPTHSEKPVEVNNQGIRKINGTASPMVSRDTLGTQITYSSNKKYSQPDTTVHIKDTTQKETITEVPATVAPVVAEIHKDTKPEKIEAPKPEFMALGVTDFTSAVQEMITTSMKEKNDTTSTLDGVHIQKEGDHFVFDAKIIAQTPWGPSDVMVTGKVIQKGSSLSVSEPKIKATLLVKGKAEKKILPLLENIFIKFEKHLAEQKGKKIESMNIDQAGIVIHFKG